MKLGKIRKIAAVTLTTLLAAGLFASCGTAGGGDTATANLPAAGTPGAPTTVAADGREKGVSNGQEFFLTGFPIVEDRITMTVLMRQLTDMPEDGNMIPLAQDLEEFSNIHIDWLMVPSVGFEDRRALMLATGDLPCIIGGHGANDTELVRFGAEGVFHCLDELMHLMPYVHEALTRREWVDPMMRTPDGRLFVTPRVDDGAWMRGHIPIINTSKLNRLGLSMPTNVNEFADVLRAFQADDPTTIGWQWFAGQPNGSFADGHALRFLMFPFGVAANPVHMFVENEQIRHNLYHQPAEFKNALDFLHMLFAEGLINQNGFTDEFDQHGANLNQIPNRVGSGVVWDIMDDIGVREAQEQFAFMPPLRGPNNEDPNVWFPRFHAWRNGFIITENALHPEIAARWIDIAYMPDWTIQFKEGRKGDRLTWDYDNSWWVVKDPPDGVNAQQWRRQTSLLELGWAVHREETENFFVLDFTIPKSMHFDIYFEEFATGTRDIWPNTTLTPREAERIAILQTALRNLTNRRVAEWVMGGNHRAEWDDYINELRSIGLEEYLQIRQAAYDRFLYHLPDEAGGGH
jgi:putative aldouronate transport system substrate-binding protein